MTKNRTATPVYLDPGMHPGLEVKGLIKMSMCCLDGPYHFVSLISPVLAAANSMLSHSLGGPSCQSKSKPQCRSATGILLQILCIHVIYYGPHSHNKVNYVTLHDTGIYRIRP